MAPQPETLSRLRSSVATLAASATQQLEHSLPWYRRLSAAERSTLNVLAHNGIASFVEYYQKPSSPGWVQTGIFGTAPTELTSSISLQRALQLIRVVVQVVEDQVPELAAPGDERLLLEAVLRYTREVAFAAADIYARTAEARGTLDTRLESLLVDAILRGETTDSLRSRLSTLGWKAESNFIVMVGTNPKPSLQTQHTQLRRTAYSIADDTLIGVQGERLIVILGGINSDPGSSAQHKGLQDISTHFAPTPVIYSSPAPVLEEISTAAKAAFSGLTAARAWPQAPRPVSAEDLWAERALNGDHHAQSALDRQIYRPLVEASNGILDTLDTYLMVSHSLEAAARELYVHANTVRYRLRKVLDITGWDPLNPRDAFVLQTALAVGRLQADPAISDQRKSTKKSPEALPTFN